MRQCTTFAMSFVLLAGVPVSADQPVDCAKSALADAVATVRDKDPVIRFTGVCAGPIVIQVEGLTLQGLGEAIIDGGGHDAVTVAGAGRVSLADFEVRNGRNGIVAINGAHLSATAC